MDLEFADEIYIFVNEKIKGLKFYDRSPSKVEQKFAGQLPEGVFHTDKHSMEQVVWDEKVNEPNATKVVHYRDGSNNARTYMVSAEKFQEILESILTAQMEGRKTFVIDTRDKDIEKESVKAGSIDRSQHLRNPDDVIRRENISGKYHDAGQAHVGETTGRPPDIPHKDRSKHEITTDEVVANVSERVFGISDDKLLKITQKKHDAATPSRGKTNGIPTQIAKMGKDIGNSEMEPVDKHIKALLDKLLGKGEKQ